MHIELQRCVLHMHIGSKEFRFHLRLLHISRYLVVFFRDEDIITYLYKKIILLKVRANKLQT